MTTTPFVAKHSEWAWSGFVLGLIVDAAFIMALSAESTLARHGITQLGRWPIAFRWFTGLASVFLNVWVSIALGDWVGVAVHLIAPALVMLLAEVGPVYMAALATAERKATKADVFAERYELNGPKPLAARFLVEPVPAEPEPVEEPEKPAEAVQEPLPDMPADEPVADKPERMSKKEADRIIEEGWKHKLTVKEVAAAATRHPATVSRRFKELDASLSV
ncbi:hypothetical protein ACWGJW_02590 [Streptomyces nigrescens]